MTKLNFIRNVALAAPIFIAMIAGLTIVTTLATQKPKPISETRSVTVKATIEAIDKTNRIITLKGPKGNLVDVQATEKIQRFDELKVGDVITATYSESIAIRVRRPGEPAPEKDKTIVKPVSGGAPGSTITDQKTVTVTVEEIDRAAPSVTVKDPDGNLFSFRIRDVKNLEGLKIGDKVDITYTVALLLEVNAMPQ